MLLVSLTALAAASGAFEEIGYFKDARRNRIFTVTVAAETPEADIKNFAAKKMNTKGQLTAVYFYLKAENNPGARVTTAGSVSEANSILDTAPQYDYVFMRYLNGATEFANCREAPDAGLC